MSPDRTDVGALRWFLLLADTVTCLALFFSSGYNHEQEFLSHEIHEGIGVRWEEDIIDLVALSAVRTALLAYLFYRMASTPPAGGYDDDGFLTKPKPYTGLHFLTHFLSVISLAYTAARVGIVESKHRHVDGQRTGSALLIASVVFSFIALVSSIWWRSYLTKKAKFFGVSINDERLGDVSGTKPSGRASLLRLFKLGRPEYPLLGAGMCALAVTSVSSISAPYFFGKVIDAATKNSMHELNQHVYILGCIYAMGAIASFFRSWAFTLAGQRLVARVRKILFKSIVSQEVAFFDVTRTGELTNRLASDTQVIQNACTVNLSMLARYFIQILGSIGIMVGVSWKLTLVLLSVVPAVAIGAVAYGRKVKDIRKAFQDCLADASTTAEENIASVQTVKCFSNEPRACSEYDKSVHESYLQGAKLALVQGGFAGLTQLLASMAILLVLWYGGTLVCNGDLTPGILTAFMLYSLQVAMAFAFLSSLYGDFMQALGASVRLFELMDRTPRIETGSGKEGAFGTTAGAPFDSTITLENVTFRYPSREDTAVLDSVSLTVPRGKIVALVGPSGGGKSTIVSLIERLYDPDAGTINLGGVDIKDLDLTWLHRKMAIVNQEPTLFACSIRDNIAYGKPDATGHEIEAAARQANAHDFIDGFENGYNTMVGERGIRLSGGQKQRVAVARALLCDPEILLLDEATSALDAESEHLVQEAIENAMVNRTVLVIAHRLSTVLNADAVVVVDGGRVVENGTHAELLKQDGVYAKLVARQLLGSANIANAVDKKTE